MKPSPKIPPPPRPAREPMTYAEAYYYRVLLYWYSFPVARRGAESPPIPALAALTRPVRSMTAVRSALLALEAKGYVERNALGRFEVCK